MIELLKYCIFIMLAAFVIFVFIELIFKGNFKQSIKSTARLFVEAILFVILGIMVLFLQYKFFS